MSPNIENYSEIRAFDYVKFCRFAKKFVESLIFCPIFGKLVLLDNCDQSVQ